MAYNRVSARTRIGCANKPSTIYVRFRNSLMAPQAALWGIDNRGAMLRVLCSNNTVDTRIENRLGEPMAAVFSTVKRQEWSRWQAAEDKPAWECREYFGRC